MTIEYKLFQGMSPEELEGIQPEALKRIAALSVSHERLLKAATAVLTHAAEFELEAAIREAENLTRDWSCGRCEQEAKGITVTIPDHHRSCAKREGKAEKL